MTYLYMYNIQMLTFSLMTPPYIKRRHHLQILENDLNHDIQRVQTWCAEIHMIVNENKTKCMLIGTKQKLSKLSNSTLAINVN